MEYKSFSKDTATHHDLDGGFALDSAPERDFGVHSAVYRMANPEFFQTFLEYGSDLEGVCYCFWVTRDRQRVGGIIIRPNRVEGLFVIPPFADGYAVLAAVKPLLLHWSDSDKDIQAVELLPSEVDMYYRLGFRADCIRRHLIRPTAPFDIAWDGDLDLRPCQQAALGEMSQLFAESFRGAAGPYGRYTQEDFRRRLDRFLSANSQDGVFGQASTLVYEKSQGRLVGACLVGLVDGVPALGYLAVDVRYRRRHLATRMIRRALTTLHGEYPLLKVQVFVGNPAESLYYGLGFQPGVERHSLRVPAGGF